MKMRGDPLLYIMIMVIMLVTILWSLLGMEYFESKFLPVLISGVVFVLAAIGLGKELLARGARAPTVTQDETSETEEAKEKWPRLLLQGSWVVGMALGIYLLGFMITMPIFILSYMKWLGTSWRTAIIFAILTPVIVYGVFQFALEMPLYPGLLFRWLDIKML